MPRAVIVSASEGATAFRPEQRLHRPEEFSAVMRARRVVRGEFFSLHFCHTDTDIRARFGLMVPKRLAPAAALRNAIKRQGREAFRLRAAEMPPGNLVLRLTRVVKGVRARDSSQKKAWRAEIESLLRRLPT